MLPSYLSRAAVAVVGVAVGVASLATPALGAAHKAPTPAPTITSGPANGSVHASRIATFAFTDVLKSSSFTCALDLAAFTNCRSPKTYTGLSTGQHTFRVRAQAPAKSVSPAVSRTWTVDLHKPAAPTVTVTGGQGDPTNQTQRSFSFAGEPDATFLCTLDDAAPAACTSPYKTPVLADGAHVLDVQQVADNGLVSDATSSGWTIDTAIPDAPTINSGPIGDTPLDTNTFTFSDEGATAFDCWVHKNGTTDNHVDCSATSAPLTASSFTTLPLADGSYVFHVRAIDAANNVSADATRNFTVNTSGSLPAAPVVTPQPPAFTKLTTETFTVPTGDGTTTIACTLDTATVDCSSGGYTTPTLADGSHTFAVTATTTGGSTTTSYTWTVDTVAPAAPVLVGAPAEGAFSAVASPLIGITTDGESTLTCTLDGTATACPSSLQPTLADGAHTLVATATDAAGNTASTTRHWTVDTKKPTSTVAAPSVLTGPFVVSYNEPVKGVTGAPAGAVILTDTGATLGTKTTTSCAPAVSCPSGTFRSLRITPTAALLAGQHYTVIVLDSTVQDRAGNTNNASTTALRGPRSVQENAPRIAVTWSPVTTTAAFGGSYVRDRLAGASASWTFTGTAVTWWTVTGPDQGKATIYVDNVRKTAVNNYATSRHFHIGRTIKGLTATTHRIRIVVQGVKGSTVGKGTFVAVDAFTVGATRTNTPTLISTWSRPTSSHYSGGAAYVAGLPKQVFSMSFRGNAVSWFTRVGPTQGKAQIWVDGVLKATVDNYAAKDAFGFRRTISKLVDKVHSVRIVVLGTHRTGGKGTFVTIDRIAVG